MGELAELLTEAMNLPVLWFFAVAVLSAFPLIALHELGHLLCARELGARRTSIRLQALPLPHGIFTFDESELRRPRDAAWVAAAGPLTTLACCSALATGAVAAGSQVLTVAALEPSGGFLLSAIPLRYGGGSESDGRAVWRILTGSVRRGEVVEESPHERIIRPVYALLLGGAGVLAVLADPLLALGLVGLFGAAFLLQRSG